MYYISTEKPINIDQLMPLMAQTYWAAERSREDVLTSVQNSVCFGAYDESDTLVGFARVVTDFVSHWYLTKQTQEIFLDISKTACYYALN